MLWPAWDHYRDRFWDHFVEFGGLTRLQAESLAAQEQGFASAGAYWRWLADYVVKRGLG